MWRVPSHFPSQTPPPPHLPARPDPASAWALGPQVRLIARVAFVLAMNGAVLLGSTAGMLWLLTMVIRGIPNPGEYVANTFFLFGCRVAISYWHVQAIRPAGLSPWSRGPAAQLVLSASGLASGLASTCVTCGGHGGSPGGHGVPSGPGGGSAAPVARVPLACCWDCCGVCRATAAAAAAAASLDETRQTRPANRWHNTGSPRVAPGKADSPTPSFDEIEDPDWADRSLTSLSPRFVCEWSVALPVSSAVEFLTEATKLTAGQAATTTASLPPLAAPLPPPGKGLASAPSTAPSVEMMSRVRALEDDLRAAEEVAEKASAAEEEHRS